MKDKTLSFWRIVVFSILAFILIYLIPSKLGIHLENIEVNKQKQIFNNNLEISDQLHPDTLNFQIDYDIELVKEIYGKFELDSKHIIEKVNQSHNGLWQIIIYGELITQLVKLFEKNILSTYAWNIIHYFFIVIICIILTFLITSKLLKPFNEKDDLINRIIQNSKFNKTIMAVVFLMCSIVTFVLSNKFSSINNQFSKQIINNVNLGFEMQTLTSIILALIPIYLLYLFLKTIKETDLKWFRNIIEIIIVIFVIFILIFSAKRINLFFLVSNTFAMACNTFLSNKIQLFVGFERCLAFGSILTLLALIIIGLSYFLIKFLFPSKQKLRITYLLKYYAISMILAFVLIIINAKVNVLNEMVTNQYANCSERDLILIGNKIQAETYQWFHQQKDIGNSTKLLQSKLTSAAEKIENLDFSKEWDDDTLVMYFKYDYKHYTRTVKFTLKVKTGETEISFQ